MAKRKPFGVYALLDSEPDVALIRYDGDPDVFAALAATWLAEQHNDYESGDYSIEPPRPRLYRFNPASDPDYSWQLQAGAGGLRRRAAHPGQAVELRILLRALRRTARRALRHSAARARDATGRPDPPAV